MPILCRHFYHFQIEILVEDQKIKWTGDGSEHHCPLPVKLVEKTCECNDCNYLNSTQTVVDQTSSFTDMSYFTYLEPSSNHCHILEVPVISTSSQHI